MKNKFLFFVLFLLLVFPFSLKAQSNICSSYSGYPSSSIYPGSQNTEAVRQLQCYLVSQNLLTLDVLNNGGFGSYGPLTTSAVANLQTQHGVDNSTGWGFYGQRTITGLENGPQSVSGTGVTPPVDVNDAQAVQPWQDFFISQGYFTRDQLGSNYGTWDTLTSNTYAKYTTETNVPVPSSSSPLPDTPYFTYQPGSQNVSAYPPGVTPPSINSNPSSSTNPPQTTTTASNSGSASSMCFRPQINYPSISIQASISFYWPGEEGSTVTSKGFSLNRFLINRNDTPYYPYPCHIWGMAAVDPTLIPYGSLIRVSVPGVSDIYYMAGDTGSAVVSKKVSRDNGWKDSNGNYLPVVDLFSPIPYQHIYKATITVTPKFFTFSGNGGYALSGGSI